MRISDSHEANGRFYLNQQVALDGRIAASMVSQYGALELAPYIAKALAAEFISLYPAAGRWFRGHSSPNMLARAPKASKLRCNSGRHCQRFDTVMLHCRADPGEVGLRPRLGRAYVAEESDQR